MLAEKLGLDTAEVVRHRLEIIGPVLVDDQLLSGAGAGAGLAREPRLPGGLHRRDDAEGPDAGAGGRERRRRRDAAGRGGGRALRLYAGRANAVKVSPASSTSCAASSGKTPPQSVRELSGEALPHDAALARR